MRVTVNMVLIAATINLNHGDVAENKMSLVIQLFPAEIVIMERGSLCNPSNPEYYFSLDFVKPDSVL